jgi:hypothetical protein
MPAGCLACLQDSAEQLHLHNPPCLYNVKPAKQTGSAALWRGADNIGSDSGCCCQDGAASKRSKPSSSSGQKEMVAATAAFEVGG